MLYFKYVFMVPILVFQDFLELKSKVGVNNNIIVTIIIYCVFINYEL